MCGLSYRQHVVNGRTPFHCRVATPSGRRWPRHCLTAHGYRAPLPRRPGCLSAAFHLPRRVTCRPIVADLPPRQRWLRRSTRRGLNIAVTGETFRYPFLPVRSWARSPPRPVFGLPGELGCGRGAAVIERPCMITTWRQRILNTGTTVAERGASADTLRVTSKITALHANDGKQQAILGHVRHREATIQETAIRDHVTGNHDTGNHKTGDHDSGDHDTGDHDWGDHDTGDHDSGDHNSRDRDSGYHDSRGHDLGDHDTGARVTGEHDTGDQNYERPRQGTSQYGRPRHG